MTEWSSSPGTLPAIVTDRVAMLFSGPHATAAARAVLAAIGPDDGWESAVELILRGGLSTLPDFFAGQLDDTGLTGVVRGEVRVTAIHRDGSTTLLSGTGLHTWREFRLTEVASFTADAGSPAAALTPTRPGPLAVSRLGGAGSSAASARPDAAPARSAPVAASPDPARTLDFSDFLDPALETPGGQQSAAVAPPSAAALAGGATTGRYDELFGATIHFGVEAAAVRAGEDDAAHSLEEPAAAVSGIVCVAGHPNPLERESCTRCGASLVGAELSRVPSPDLGVVVLPDGRAVPLAGTVLIGRSPRADRIDGDDIPTLVTVDDPDVSRTHVRIRTEGWQVLLEDLGSTNGTVFTAQGTGPRRIRPGESVLVTDGAFADLGPHSRVTFSGVP